MGNFGRIQLGGGQSDRDAAGNNRIKLRRTNEDGTTSPVTFLKDSEDLQWAMTVCDPVTGKCLYDTSAVYRESIKDLVANSPDLMAEPTLARRSAIPNDAEMLEGMRHDAVRQLHDRMVDAFGSNDLVGKYNIAQEIVTAEGPTYEAFNEMNELTTQDRPHEQYLKDRKAAGEGPLQWVMEVDKDKAIGEVADGSDQIFVVPEGE